MTAEINKAVERLTRQMFDADTHYGSDRLGWMVGDVATEDLRLVISELTRLREEVATLTRERDEARERVIEYRQGCAEVFDALCPVCRGGATLPDKARDPAWLGRQSKEGGE